MNKELLQYFKPILSIADKGYSTEDEKLQHGFLIYMGLLMSMGGLMWGSLCLLNELYLPASIPFAYVLITTLNFLYLYKSKNFIFAQNLQIFISLMLPFFFQFFLGGFVASGGNVLWSVLAVFGSFTLRRRQASVIWLVLFIFVMILSGIVDSEAKKFDAGFSEPYTILFFVVNFILTISIIFTLYYYFVNSEEKARANLQNTIEQLKIAQERLIESEKMASLGSLVSGVAHEINTPLGVGLTGVSQINHEIKKLELNYKEESLTEEALLESVSTIKQLTQTIQNRLNNAVTLVKSFKHISIDQHFEDIREFNLGVYTQDLLLSLQAPLKSKNVKIINNIDSNINLESYPGIYSQIFSNLILNSVKHAFKEESENIIKISASMGDSLIINYEDNGIGIDDEIEKKIFDPFFTTKRGQGGSGLGLNIVYNLVVQKLGGSIEIIRVSPHGLGFKIKINTTARKE